MMDTPKDTPIDPSCPRLAPRLSLLARSFPPLSLIFLWRVRLAQGGGGTGMVPLPCFIIICPLNTGSLFPDLSGAFKYGVFLSL